MAQASALLTELPAWQALEAHHQKLRDLHLRQLFAQDPRRGERMTAVGLLCRQCRGWGPDTPALLKGVTLLEKVPPAPTSSSASAMRSWRPNPDQPGEG